MHRRYAAVFLRDQTVIRRQPDCHRPEQLIVRSISDIAASRSVYRAPYTAALSLTKCVIREHKDRRSKDVVGATIEPNVSRSETSHHTTRCSSVRGRRQTELDAASNAGPNAARGADAVVLSWFVAGGAIRPTGSFGDRAVPGIDAIPVPCGSQLERLFASMQFQPRVAGIFCLLEVAVAAVSVLCRCAARYESEREKRKINGCDY